MVKKNSKVVFIAVWVTSLFLIVAPPSPAGANDQGKTSGDVPTREAINLGAITVTAEKQEENVKKVPMAVSVIDSMAIEDLDIRSVNDVANIVPNLMIFQGGTSGMNVPSMRGINAFVDSYSISTGMFVDGVPITTSVGFEESVLDVERIEVLRGPQGALYGKNTEAGVINIITKQPGNEFKGIISLEGGMLLSGEGDDSDLAGEGTFSVSGPMVENTLFYSIAGKYHSKDGFIKNSETGETVNDREHWYGRTKFLWTPTDDLSVTVTASRLQYDDGANNMSLSEDGAAAYGLPAFDDRTVSSNGDADNTSHADAFSANVNYDLNDHLTLTSLTSYRTYNQQLFVDWDFSPMTMMHADKDYTLGKFSQELRLGYTNQGWKWLTGVYYDHDENDLDYEMISDIPDYNFPSSKDLTGDVYAAFTHLTIPFGSDFSLVGGLRYDYQAQTLKNNLTALEEDESWNSFNPKVAVEHQISPEIMTYMSVTRGDRSGGFNLLSLTPAYMTYEGESLWSYEWGVKSLLLDNRVMLNSVVYYMDISDMQVEESVSTYETYVTNAAEATSVGFEIELNAMVTKELTLIGSYGYNHIEFDDFTDSLGDHSGNTPPYAPEYTYYAGAQYRHPDGWYGSVGVKGCGKIYLDKLNTYSRDSYELVDMKLGYEMEDFDIYLYGKNVFDKEYNSVGTYGGYYTSFSEPGEVGMKLVYRF